GDMLLSLAGANVKSPDAALGCNRNRAAVRRDRDRACCAGCVNPNGPGFACAEVPEPQLTRVRPPNKGGEHVGTRHYAALTRRLSSPGHISTGSACNSVPNSNRSVSARGDELLAIGQKVYPANRPPVADEFSALLP